MTDQKKRFNMQVFSDVGHGFAVSSSQQTCTQTHAKSYIQSRAFLSDPYEKWAKEQSFKSFIDWFDFWLSAA